MVIGVDDGLGWVAAGQVPRTGLTINDVVGSAIPGEVGRFVNEGTTLYERANEYPGSWEDPAQNAYLGVGAGGGSIPESTAEVNSAEAE
ncbi:hypothetical protein NMY22_g10608 [Coprinellus aureogranulatus]|nr:hypothetical protein NMY22_g10608 [Coprinellus aureogranulatus]